MLFSERLLGALDDVVLRLFGKHIEESAVACDTDDQILVILRVALRVDQRLTGDNVVLKKVRISISSF